MSEVFVHSLGAAIMVDLHVAESHGSILFDILSAGAMRDRDSREDVRYPFIRPVVVHAGDQALKALTREISRSGIGLTHKAPLQRGEYQLTAALGTGHLAQIPISIRWCQKLDEEWYISGAMFLVDDAAEQLSQPASND